MGKHRKKYSNDPKVRVLSLEEFFVGYNYFKNGGFIKNEWRDDSKPIPEEVFFKATSDKFIAISFTYTYVNYGTIEREKLDYIQVAFRDGKTEYELLDKEISRIKDELSLNKKRTALLNDISNIEKLKAKIPPYNSQVSEAKPKKFNEYLIDVGYKTDPNNHENKYIVFDVETNGIRTRNDDLLSLSIYDPYSGLCYNRFFPLDLQPVILTTFVHGITEGTLKNATHMTQEEMDQIIEFFDLKNRTLLSYSGSGTFDSSFVNNYCERHNIHGFEDLSFENIKSSVPQTPFGSAGELSKDNLCRMFHIEGIKTIHSGVNDCLLEWKLFEKIKNEPLFFIGNNLYRYHKEYIVPISYTAKHPELFRYAEAKTPLVIGFAKNIFEYNFSKKQLSDIKKFPTNITGVTIEHAINTMLSVKEQNNRKFLADNKKHLEFVGSLESNIIKIPIIKEDDGTIKTIDPEFKQYVEEINKVTNSIMKSLTPTIEFIKNNIFYNEPIMSQELVISEDKKVLALCDLSDRNNILEIKTKCIFEDDQYGFHISSDISEQLYYQSKNRNVYIMSILFDKDYDLKMRKIFTSSLKISIYSVELKEQVFKPPVFKPTWYEARIIKELIRDGSQTHAQLSMNVEIGDGTLSLSLGRLKREGYIVREGSPKKGGYWKVLKDEEGNPTQ